MLLVRKFLTGLTAFSPCSVVSPERDADSEEGDAGGDGWQVTIFLFLYCCFSFFDVPVPVSDIN